MTILCEKAPAKINLSLDILAKRDDGYHDLRTVMASVSLCDELTVTLAPCQAGAERFTAAAEGVKGENLAARAAELFMRSNGISGWSADIQIEKRIPVSAGLGGGSSDAAAVLRALNGWRPMPPEGLAELALNLGSDVPYCLRGGVCLAQGRGEILSPLPPLPDCWIVLITPPVAVSTAEAFQLWDTLSPFHQEMARMSGNVFEAVIKLPEIEQIKQILLEAGAAEAMMSGSGSTVFGVFTDETEANKAFETLHIHFPKTFLATPV
ncbi:MAG: 4-(cytidine 5'-diphospho)-2-C-methyl-D-erythritol kinase [Oscillospiraceae bacterium]|nr:4-(cytidine 5'-diphospho)-2-C-methyl-D-erythritol kinase [Oscillospiraceae bacterium]